MGPVLLVLVVILLFGAGGVFAWWLVNQPVRGVVEDTLPPPPDEVPPIEPDVEPLPETPPLALEAAIQNQEGYRHFQAARFDSASRYFEEAVRLAPDSVTYRYNFGLSLLRLGETRASMREFQRVLRQDAEHAAAHFFLGEAQLALGDTTSAITALEAAHQYATDARERRLTDQRLREVRAAVLQPPPLPPPGPDIDLPPGAGGDTGADADGAGASP